MKRIITFLIATPVVWLVLIWLIGRPFMNMVVSLNFNGAPIFIHSDEEAMTVAKWVLGFTGLLAAVFGAEVAAIAAEWERFIQRLLEPRRRRRY
ncbi:MAG: hypothetical protein PCFJNLEI_03097 [Verrucomicrobiae bacterium]|nr:hypothetical protein [Verrucomicrobiae bacterium]